MESRLGQFRPLEGKRAPLESCLVLLFWACIRFSPSAAEVDGRKDRVELVGGL